jgi:hypothetical protein
MVLELANRWRNFAVIITVIVVALAVIYLPPAFVPAKGITFEQGKSSIAAIWEKNGIAFDPSNPVVEAPKLNALKSGLLEYRQEISALEQSRDRAAILDYLAIQLKIVEGMELYGKVDESYAVLLESESSAVEICPAIDSLQSLAEDLGALNALTVELAGMRKAFAETYPQFAQVAGEEMALEEPMPEGIEADVNEIASLCEEGGYA